MTGVELIAAERQRQIEVEKWTPEYDDGHHIGEMARASACYAMRPYLHMDKLAMYWPWDMKWWKPCPNDRIRELSKAGALIAAEIDRLKRRETQG